MALDPEINDAIKKAMLAKDAVKLRTLRAIKAAFLLAKTEKGSDGNLTEAQEQKIIQKLYNQRKESVEIFQKEGREELAANEREEMEVLESLLPKQLTDEELELVVKEIVSTVGATGPADMGKVMGKASQDLAGKADGKRISAIARKLLAEG